MNGDNGHGEQDVLYLAFAGENAVPGSAADWKAKTYTDFEASIQHIGDSLVSAL